MFNVYIILTYSKITEFAEELFVEKLNPPFSSVLLIGNL